MEKKEKEKKNRIDILNRNRQLSEQRYNNQEDDMNEELKRIEEEIEIEKRRRNEELLASSSDDGNGKQIENPSIVTENGNEWTGDNAWEYGAEEE